MEDKNKRALIVAYYLSKYDYEALNNLGYSKFKEAFRDIANKLDVKENTIKNMRDEFDPIHTNSRVGWYQRELRPSRERIISKFSNLSENALREIVKSIIDNTKNYEEELNFKEIALSDEKEENNTRTITGKTAERIFEKYFIDNLKGEYELIDTSADGCGYDYKTSNKEGEVYEVKGSKNKCVDILLTDKEWEVAGKLKEKYNLVLVSNVYDEKSYSIEIINNPYDVFKPKQIIEKIIAVKWRINTNKDLIKK